MPASAVSVAPSCQLSSPARRPWRPTAAAAPSAASTTGSSAGTSAGGTAPDTHSIAGGCAASHGSAAAARAIQSSNSRSTREP